MVSFFWLPALFLFYRNRLIVSSARSASLESSVGLGWEWWGAFVMALGRSGVLFLFLLA